MSCPEQHKAAHRADTVLSSFAPSFSRHTIPVARCEFPGRCQPPPSRPRRNIGQAWVQPIGLMCGPECLKGEPYVGIHVRIRTSQRPVRITEKCREGPLHNASTSGIHMRLAIKVIHQGLPTTQMATFPPPDEYLHSFLTVFLLRIATMTYIPDTGIGYLWKLARHRLPLYEGCEPRGQ